MAVLALEFLILTPGRSGEVLGARWTEIDIGAKVWTVPAARMKVGREHRVPLSGRALVILLALPFSQVGGLLALRVCGLPLNMSSFMGLIMLVGLVSLVCLNS